jgi:hypothetical protein
MLNAERTLAAIRQSDVSYFSGHAGTASVDRGRQVIQVRGPGSDPETFDELMAEFEAEAEEE